VWDSLAMGSDALIRESLCLSLQPLHLRGEATCRKPIAEPQSTQRWCGELKLGNGPPRQVVPAPDGACYTFSLAYDEPT